jgi:hypothetical protein
MRLMRLGFSRLRFVSLLAGPALALMLCLLTFAGCGGATAASGYICTIGRSAIDNGCFRAATWGASDTTPFQAVSTDVLVTPLSCAGECLTSANHDPAVSGSGSNTPGGIYNYLQLSAPGLSYFIRIGYGAITGAGTPQYFVDARLPISDSSGSMISPQYRRILLSPTGVPPAPAGGYRYTQLSILGARSGLDGAGPFLDWYACLALPATSGRSPFQAPMCTLLGNTETRADILGDPLANSFDPAQYSVGEHVYGFGGATADYAAFTNTQFSTTPAIGYEDMTGAQETDWSISGSHVSIQSSTPVSVPYAGWVTTPAQSPSNGGIFYVECCRPLSS